MCIYICIYIWVTYIIFKTNLNSSAIKGDDFPDIDHDSRVRENSEVVIIYPHICMSDMGFI